MATVWLPTHEGIVHEEGGVPVPNENNEYVQWWCHSCVAVELQMTWGAQCTMGLVVPDE